MTAAPPSPPNGPSRPPVDRLRILLESADSPKGERLDVGEEFRRIRERVGNREGITVEQRSALTYERLIKDLGEVDPHVLHIGAHGEPGHLILRPFAPGGSAKVAHGLIRDLAREIGKVLRLFVANACYSSELAAALVGDAAGSIEVAIGTEDQLQDRDAVVYASGLYSMISDGFAVGTAHKVALLLLLAYNPDVGTDEIPRLFVRQGTQADEYVLVERRREPRRSDVGQADEGARRSNLRELSLPELRLLMVVQVGRTLAKRREVGKIRGDIRPDNVLIDADGRARLGDLGVDYVSPLPMRDVYRYTPPRYHHSDLDVAVRSEIYSLAMLTLFALTGSDPEIDEFQTDRYAFIERLDCPRRLRLLLARALTASPHHRHSQDVNEFCYQLHACIEDRELWGHPGAQDDALAMLHGLERMPADQFDELVGSAEQAAAQLAATQGSRVWRCREGSQGQRASDLLNTARRTQDTELLAKIRAHAVPLEPLGAVEPAASVQTLENAFVELCSFPLEWFEGVLIDYEKVIANQPIDTNGPRRPRGAASQLSRAASLVDLCARPAAESRLLTDIRGIVRRFRQPVDPMTPYLRVSWIHAQLCVVLDRLKKVSDIAGLDRLVSTRNYDRLHEVLLDIPNGPDFPLRLLPLVDQAEALAYSALEVCRFDRLKLSIDLEPRFSLYRTLCRLRPPAWKGVWSKFMLPCMLPANTNRATVVRALIDHTAPWCLPALREAIRPFADSSTLAADPPGETAVIDVETEIEALPADLLAELALRMGLHIASPTTEEPGHDLRLVVLTGTPDRPGQEPTAYPEELRTQLSQLCGEVRGPWRGKTTSDALDEKARGALDEQLCRYGVAELRRIWTSLRLPEWFQPPAEALHRDAVVLLTDFSAWIRLPWWQSAVAEAAGQVAPLLARIERERG